MTLNRIETMIHIRVLKYVLLISFCMLFQSVLNAQLEKHSYKHLNHFPKEHWDVHNNPVAAGWDLATLEKARQFAKELGSSSVLLIHRGMVILDWGDSEKKFKCHSIRKSFLFSLIGIYESKGLIDVNKNLAQLGIDDREPLSNAEKQATILQMLKCRSGVYHPAAYETKSMAEKRPARESHAVGSFYYYNNWDFNTLCAIFEQETNKKIFEEFNEQIAQPLNMEHFKIEDGKYLYDREKSNFPAYPFVMSSKDLARYGMLYLNNGNWDGQQIISSDWIRKELTPYSNLKSKHQDAMKWTILSRGPLAKLGAYYTSGYRGHRLFVLPEVDMVFVHRVNTFTKEDRVGGKDIRTLLKMILKANPKALPESVRSELEK